MHKRKSAPKINSSEQNSSSMMSLKSTGDICSESLSQFALRTDMLVNIHGRVQSLQYDINIKTLENLVNIVKEADTINDEVKIEEKIKGKGEAVLDSQIMQTSSNVLNKCSVFVSKRINTYDPIEFAQKIKSFLLKLSDCLTEDHLRWSLLGGEIMSYFQRTAQFSSISLKFVFKIKPARKARIAKEAIGPVKRPQLVTSEKIKDEVKDSMNKIGKIIQNYCKIHNKPVDFFALVLHPTDFAKTIENMLHLSYYMRENKVKLVMDADGIPQLELISSINNSEQQEVAENEEIEQKFHNLMSFNMQQWRALVQAYQISVPMIK